MTVVKGDQSIAVQWDQDFDSFKWIQWNRKTSSINVSSTFEHILNIRKIAWTNPSSYEWLFYDFIILRSSPELENHLLFAIREKVSSETFKFALIVFNWDSIGNYPSNKLCFVYFILIYYVTNWGKLLEYHSSKLASDNHNRLAKLMNRSLLLLLLFIYFLFFVFFCCELPWLVWALILWKWVEISFQRSSFISWIIW